MKCTRSKCSIGTNLPAKITSSFYGTTSKPNEFLPERNPIAPNSKRQAKTFDQEFLDNILYATCELFN